MKYAKEANRIGRLMGLPDVPGETPARTGTVEWHCDHRDTRPMMPDGKLGQRGCTLGSRRTSTIDRSAFTI